MHSQHVPTASREHAKLRHLREGEWTPTARPIPKETFLPPSIVLHQVSKLPDVLLSYELQNENTGNIMEPPVDRPDHNEIALVLPLKRIAPSKRRL